MVHDNAAPDYSGGVAAVEQGTTTWCVRGAGGQNCRSKSVGSATRPGACCRGGTCRAPRRPRGRLEATGAKAEAPPGPGSPRASEPAEPWTGPTALQDRHGSTTGRPPSAKSTAAPVAMAGMRSGQRAGLTLQPSKRSTSPAGTGADADAEEPAGAAASLAAVS